MNVDRHLGDRNFQNSYQNLNGNIKMFPWFKVESHLEHFSASRELSNLTVPMMGNCDHNLGVKMVNIFNIHYRTFIGITCIFELF